MDDLEVPKEKFLAIASVSGCLEIISNTIASLPIKLYDSTNGKIKVLEDDPRVNLLNDSTGDTLDGFQFKKALICDYLSWGEGFAYLNRYLNSIKSIHYTDTRKVSKLYNQDPIFKHCNISVQGVTYEDYEFLKLLRRTKNGVDGVGILDENYDSLKVMYHSLVYEDLLVSSGGNKKGFVKSQSKLSEPAVKELKQQWNDMYRNNTSNCIVLNNGLEFQESANTSVEMQLNENKITNSKDVCKMFGIPESILNGSCTNEQYQSFIKITIIPILKMFETALNVALLSNKERAFFYFSFDTKELLKGDIEKRMKAYGEAIRNGIMQVDEVRYLEDLEPLGLNFIKLGLQDVLYDPVSKTIYTPNTNKTADIKNMKGDDSKNEDRDPEE
ncbi:phage portal protein [Clostridium butyricum]|uniref:phage portal protein n=1 Tax=Clostridium butyricum TaxID=1492 RepID=UPI002ABE378A|nr:phage portal protein [Clostridium butyricum]